MVTNLLRSEHIPYNVFFPMRYDLDGTARLFNRILGEERIAAISKINIEYNPKGLADGTSLTFISNTLQWEQIPMRRAVLALK